MSAAEYIYHFAKETPHAQAMIYNGRSISYEALAGAICATGAAIDACHIESPATVAVVAPRLAECWAITIAAQALGFTTICVSSAELLESLNVRSLSALLVADGANFGTPPHHADLPAFTVSKPDFSSIATPGYPEIRGGGGHILYTSGTTGEYKKYFLASSSQRARDLERTRYYNWDHNTRFHGLGFGLWTAVGNNLPPSVWSVGGCVILDQEAGWSSRFHETNPSFAYLLPDMAKELSEQTPPEPSSPGTGQAITLYVAGGFLSESVARKLCEHESHSIVITYGSSEVNAAVFDQAYHSKEDLSWITPTGNRVVEIVDEHEEPCPTHQQGYLRVKLTELDTHGYVDDPVATADSFRDSYFYPGDMAVQREDGKFRILGRVADVVNLGGQKLAAAPIEANLQNVLQVDYVCIFSGMDSTGETVVHVAMETGTLPAEDRLDHVRRELSQWGAVHFIRITSFPRTRSGTSKIDRKRLREMVVNRTTP